jgi:hypothetical protein
MVGAPALSDQKEELMDAFALGDNGRVYHKRYASGWAPGYWTDLGGDFAPARDKSLDSASPQVGRVELVARGLDGSVWHRSCSGGTEELPCAWDEEWSGPLAPPEGSADTSGPALAVNGDRLDVFVRHGTDLYQNTLTDGSWGTWTMQPGPIAETPAATSAHGITHVIAATDNGGLVAKSGDVSALPETWVVVDSSGVLAPNTSPAIDAGRDPWIDIYFQTPTGMLGHHFAADATDPSAPVWNPQGWSLGGILEGSPALAVWASDSDGRDFLHAIVNIEGSGPWHKSSPF